MRQQHSLNRARQIHLDFGGDVLVFAFRDPQGEEWEGCLEEWVGNDNFYGSDSVLSQEEHEHIAI